eukprot:jgi/Mesen1/561/ME000105S10732
MTRLVRERSSSQSLLPAAPNMYFGPLDMDNGEEWDLDAIDELVRKAEEKKAAKRAVELQHDPLGNNVGHSSEPTQRPLNGHYNANASHGQSNLVEIQGTAVRSGVYKDQHIKPVNDLHQQMVFGTSVSAAASKKLPWESKELPRLTPTSHDHNRNAAQPQCQQIPWTSARVQDIPHNSSLAISNQSCPQYPSQRVAQIHEAGMMKDISAVSENPCAQPGAVQKSSLGGVTGARELKDTLAAKDGAISLLRSKLAQESEGEKVVNYKSTIQLAGSGASPAGVEEDRLAIEMVELRRALAPMCLPASSTEWGAVLVAKLFANCPTSIYGLLRGTESEWKPLLQEPVGSKRKEDGVTQQEHASQAQLQDTLTLVMNKVSPSASLVEPLMSLAQSEQVSIAESALVVLKELIRLDANCCHRLQCGAQDCPRCDATGCKSSGVHLSHFTLPAVNTGSSEGEHTNRKRAESSSGVMSERAASNQGSRGAQAPTFRSPRIVVVSTSGASPQPHAGGVEGRGGARRESGCTGDRRADSGSGLSGRVSEKPADEGGPSEATGTRPKDPPAARSGEGEAAPPVDTERIGGRSVSLVESAGAHSQEAEAIRSKGADDAHCLMAGAGGHGLSRSRCHVWALARLAAPGVSSGPVQEAALGVLNALVANAEPRQGRRRFRFLLEGDIFLGAQWGQKVSLRPRALQLLQLLLRCPHLLALVLEQPSPSKERRNVEGGAALCPTGSRSYWQLIAAVADCLTVNEGGPQDYACCRQALQVLAYLAGIGEPGVGALLQIGADQDSCPIAKPDNSRRDETLDEVVHGDKRIAQTAPPVDQLDPSSTIGAGTSSRGGTGFEQVLPKRLVFLVERALEGAEGSFQEKIEGNASLDEDRLECKECYGSVM